MTRAALVVPTALFVLLTLPALAADDRVQVARDITIEQHESFADVVCVGCSIRVEGSVTADAVTIGGSLHINGPVRGDAVALGGNVTLGPKADVGGDAVALGGRLERDPQARVGGEAVAPPGLAIASRGLAWLLLFGLVACSVINIGFAALCYAVAGAHRLHTVAQTVRQRGAAAVLAGIAGVVGAVILFIIAAFTGPATPVIATVVSVLLVLALIVGYAGLSTWVGQTLARTAGPLAALLLGALVITVLQLIPILNFLTLPIFALLALGSAILSGFGAAPNWLSRQLSPPSPDATPPPTLQ